MIFNRGLFITWFFIQIIFWIFIIFYKFCQNSSTFLKFIFSKLFRSHLVNIIWVRSLLSRLQIRAWGWCFTIDSKMLQLWFDTFWLLWIQMLKLFALRLFHNFESIQLVIIFFKLCTFEYCLLNKKVLRVHNWSFYLFIW